MEIALVLMEVPYCSTDLRLFAKRALQVSCFFSFVLVNRLECANFHNPKEFTMLVLFVGINCLKTNIFNEEFQPVASLSLLLKL